jgi:hypothetical protein
MRTSLNLQVYTNRDDGRVKGLARAEADWNKPRLGTSTTEPANDGYLMGVVQK